MGQIWNIINPFIPRSDQDQNIKLRNPDFNFLKLGDTSSINVIALTEGFQLNGGQNLEPP